LAMSKYKKVNEQKGNRTVTGFNSIFAVRSIPQAKLYYDEFKRQLKESDSDLRIATIFSYSPNSEDFDNDYLDMEEDFDNENLCKSDRDFLEQAISDYNTMFNTTWDTSADNFQSYYKDVSMRMKNRDIDLLIVVNMFLTGFDATTLNTLWVDKNLRMHGLIQAFSRTNRILNDIKQFGNIICFRKLEEATDKAIALFGNKEAKGIVVIKTFEEYYNGYLDGKKHILGYKELIENLLEQFDLDSFKEKILGEENEKRFIVMFGNILRLKNILSTFDEFDGKEILSPFQLQNYMSEYNDLYDKYKRLSFSEKADILNDIIFEIELIKQIEVNIDYILNLVEKYFKSKENNKNDILKLINKAIGSSTELRSKRDLILDFIKRESVSYDVSLDWVDYVREQKEKELNTIIEEEKLIKDKVIRFMDLAFEDGVLKTTGTVINDFLGSGSRLAQGPNNRIEKRKRVLGKLLELFEKYIGVYFKGE
jgi:type I restriction enzyme R subunit